MTIIRPLLNYNLREKLVLYSINLPMIPIIANYTIINKIITNFRIVSACRLIENN